MATHRITQADIKDWAKNYKGPLFDGILCDPPYELGFMGKSWDSSGIAFDTEMWADLFKLIKPGGHLLAFSGSRTYHRMAVAIEDAGFEIRDMIEWVYGSGFPKSLNIGKAVDKMQGNERKVTGHQEREGRSSGILGKKVQITRELSQGTSEWEGYGTALKPAHESVCVAQKPLETSTETEYIISICQKLFAQIATNRSMLSPQEQKEVSGIVQWLAENNINTLEDLSEAMAILQSCIKGVTSLNIVWSWLITLAEIWQAMNMSTISTRLNTITELKILDSLEWASILRSIMLPKNNKTDGLNASVYNADSLLNAVRLKLQDTLTRFADESAISKAGNQGLLPRSEPCVLARKPLEGTVANNVLKHGTGGLNIDGTRVGTDDNLNKRYESSFQEGNSQFVSETATHSGKRMEIKAPEATALGRFPANLIHDGSDEVEAVFPNSKSASNTKSTSGNHFTAGNAGVATRTVYENGAPYAGETGSASRFFYCAKSSRAERNAGLDGTVSIKVQLEICENNITRQENLARLQVVMDNSHLKATAESGTGTKSGTEWSMSLFGNQYTEKYPINIKSTTKTTTNSTTTSVILNWLIGLLTNESTLGVNLEMENGGSPADGVESFSTLTATISDQTALALGVNPALASKRLLISVSDGKNFHSTVKPLSLTKYLATLIKPPTGGRLLVPFSGSGSEMIGALQAGWGYVEGVELTEEYIPIAEARIKYWLSRVEEEDKQGTLL